MKAKSRGFEINYAVQGEGEPLVLIPGFMQRLQDWQDYGYVDSLAGRFRVITVNPLGHGASDEPYEAGSYLRDDTAADVIAVLDAEQIDAAHIWGYSRGAGIALVIGTLFPQRVNTLIAGGAFLAAPNTAVPARPATLAPLLRKGKWQEFFEAFPIKLDKEMEAAFAASNDPVALAASMEGSSLSGSTTHDLSALSGRSLLYAGTAEAWLQAPGAIEAYRANCDASGVRLEPLRGLTHAEGFVARKQIEPTVRAFIDEVLVH